MLPGDEGAGLPDAICMEELAAARAWMIFWPSRGSPARGKLRSASERMEGWGMLVVRAGHLTEVGIEGGPWWGGGLGLGGWIRQFTLARSGEPDGAR